MGTYRVIPCRGHLDQHWAAWFDGLTIINGADREGMRAGPFRTNVLAIGVIRVSITPGDIGTRVRMRDLLQRRNAPEGLNAGEEVLPGDLPDAGAPAFPMVRSPSHA